MVVKLRLGRTSMRLLATELHAICCDGSSNEDATSSRRRAFGNAGKEDPVWQENDFHAVPLLLHAERGCKTDCASDHTLPPAENLLLQEKLLLKYCQTSKLGFDMHCASVIDATSTSSVSSPVPYKHMSDWTGLLYSAATFQPGHWAAQD